MNPRRVVIVGAGAAGLMAAVWAARRARSLASPVDVVLLERTRDGGRKILISGGGRCNILPAASRPERFVTGSSPNTLRRMLRSWPLAEQRSFFENEVGLRLVLEEETGKLFPDTHHAKDVRDALVALAAHEGARLMFRRRVMAVHPNDDGWRLEFEDGEPLLASAVVIATGGESIPSTGSDGFGFEVARRLGHRVVPTYPALTPLTGGGAELHALAGISTRVTLAAGTGRARVEAKGGFLFTHRGFSGPVVLDLSHHVVRDGADARLRVRWVETAEEELDRELRAGGMRSVLGVLRAHLPERLACVLAAEVGVAGETRIAELRREERHALLEQLLRWRLPATGHEGYRKAEVTGGGVHLGEVEPRTLCSRSHAGLYFCGEVLDAFGPIGGHNFAWAWATGRAAGEAAVVAQATRAQS